MSACAMEVSETFPEKGRRNCGPDQEERADSLESIVDIRVARWLPCSGTFPEITGGTGRTAAQGRTDRGGHTYMSRSAGSPARRLGLAAGVVGALAGLVVLVVATVSPAASVRGSVAPSALQRTAAHKCLVMTGSGDPAFVRNFNP